MKKSSKVIKSHHKSHHKKPNRKTNYYCPDCDYTTALKSDYTKHKKTKKHLKKSSQMPKKSSHLAKSHHKQKMSKKEPFGSGIYENEPFGSKRTKNEPKTNQNGIVGLINPDYLKLVEENQKLKEQLKDQKIEQLEKENDYLKTIKGNSMGNHNNVNSNNTNNITVNMYLNDHCKDAMFLDDFVNQIKLKLADVIQGEMPVENAISNVFIQKLEDLDPTKRPIHCTDQKRKQFMVNDKAEGWIKDNTFQENSKLTHSLTSVQQKAFLDVYDEFDEKFKPPHEDNLERKKSKVVGLIRDPLISGKGTKDIIKNVAPVTNIRDAINELKTKK
tara:strand:+ start:856 stop:1845 length:990 start_codon:yes stop_codon:yes gene_type:complete